MAKITAKPANPTPAAQEPGGDEPQTVFLPPAEGGSYLRNADGSLTLREKPTEVPPFNPAKE